MRIIVGHRASAGATHWYGASGFTVLTFPFTLMFWGCQNTLTAGVGMSVNQEAQTVLQNTAGIAWTSAGIAQMQTYDSTANGTADNFTGTHTAIAIQEWHHTAGVWASATDRRLYLDGVRVANSTTSRVFANLDQVRVSGRGNATTSAGRWQGWSCEHALVKSNFTDAEMLAFYAHCDYRVFGNKLWHFFPCPSLVTTQASDMMSSVAFPGNSAAYTEPTAAWPRQFNHFSMNSAA
jgi:hypothetical protein